MINPTPVIRIVRETASTATVDGDNGLGLIVGPKVRYFGRSIIKPSLFVFVFYS
jgi:LDH2 family malate/lactate/ureidoglycolate dehydrogenase